MFTGIVEEVGTVEQPGARMRVVCRQVLDGSKIGSSIAVNGTCLTAVEIDASGFGMDLSPETLARTNLGDLRAGDLVNLERPLALGDRLSGHLVQGHVDGTGKFRRMDALADGNWWLAVEVPPELERYMILKGSVTLDGISLTIAALEGNVVMVAIIPHTYEQTNLRKRFPGDRVNVEADMFAKYVEKMMAANR
ncbi:MAG: riboflavin synthase [Acidobacteriaceae bacterium]|nr:riboflavin synthase [Acidobacteriaceae bacterium]